MDFANRELITPVRGSIEIRIRPLSITPKNQLLFPLLCQIARNFELYKYHKLEFYYKSQLGESNLAPITTQGTCMFNITYDATLPTFTSKNELLNYEGAVTCKPTENMKIALRPMYKFKDVFPLITSNNTLMSDIRNTSPGTVFFATQGQDNNNDLIGDIYCYYEITLAKPRLYNSIGGNTYSYYAIYRAKSSGQTWCGRYFTEPLTTSYRQKTIECIWIDETNFTINIRDGWIIMIRFQSPRANAMAAGTGNFEILGNQLHEFIPFEPDMITYTDTPRTATFATNCNPKQSFIQTATSSGGFLCRRLVQEMVVKCRGPVPLTITCPTTINPFANQYITHEIYVMNKPESFDQNLGNNEQIYNGDWFST